MFGGISGKRLALYGAAVMVLVGLNLLNWQSGGTGGSERESREATRLLQTPGLHVAGELGRTAQLGSRDLFSRNPLPEEEEPEPAVTAPPVRTAEPDPDALVMSNARKALSDIRLVGVMSAGDSSLAVLYHNGNTTNRAVGDEIVPGYKVDRITRDDVQLRNDDAGVAAVLSMGGRKPMQLIRVD